MTYGANDLMEQMELEKAGSGHRANGNRADVVAPTMLCKYFFYNLNGLVVNVNGKYKKFNC